MCDSDKFRFKVGKDARIKVTCHSATCGSRSKGTDRDPAWFREVVSALEAAGVPRTVLPSHAAAQPSPAARKPTPGASARRPAHAHTDGEVERWMGAVQGARVLALAEARGISDEVLRDAEVGWDSERRDRCYTFPIRDVRTGELLETDYYGLRAKPKMVHQLGGTTHFYSPDGIDKSKPIVVCEGHIDALVARSHGLNAVAVTGGAESLPPEEEFAAFAGADVVIAFDCDPAGRRGAAKLADSFLSHGAQTVTVLDLTDEGLTYRDKSGEDISDWFNCHDKSAADLLALADSTAAWEEEGGDSVLAAIRALMLADRDDAEDHMDDLHDDDEVLDLPEPGFVIDGWVPRGLYTMLYGEPGVGKTFALLGMARAVRRGTRWQDHKTAKGGVLFYQGEGLAQLKPRIRAWDDRYPLRPDQSMSPGASLERTVDVTKAEGVAAIARTVRRFERERGCEVQMVVIDPLVEFMTGDENGDGMTEATKGLRALAGFLDVAVVVGHHTNASGERARGADYHRMRAGSFIRMEPRGEDTFGLLQEKQKNAEQLALTLDAVEHGESIVLEWVENVTAAEYRRAKEEVAKSRKRAEKTAASSGKRREAFDLLREVIQDGEFAQPADRSTNNVISRALVIAGERQLDLGRPVLKETLSAMVDPHVHGLVRVEQGANRSTLHYWIGDDDA